MSFVIELHTKTVIPCSLENRANVANIIQINNDDHDTVSGNEEAVFLDADERNEK